MYFRDLLDKQNFVYTFVLLVADEGYMYYDLAYGSKFCIEHFSAHCSMYGSIMGVHRCEHAFYPSKHVPVMVDVSVDKESTILHDDTIIQGTPAFAWKRLRGTPTSTIRRNIMIIGKFEEYEVTRCNDVKCVRD